MALLDKIKSLLSKGKQGTVKADKNVNRRVIFIGVLLVVAIVITIALISMATLQSRTNASYLDLIAEQQIISQQIVINAVEASYGRDNGFASLKANHDRYLEILGTFDTGDVLLDISPLPETYSVEYLGLK
ncbi:MAG: hypothetical protein GY763_02570, partial [Gammaproteobacteria bacterium]|nr:hypothetical protein [Gammaproteobacteria bacterium]